MKFGTYQVSRKGGREKNEDRMGYCYTRDSGLFALADGMGGHPEGEVASQLALQTIAAYFQKEAKTDLKDPQRFLQDSILAGHHQLLRYATDRGLTDTPRTTIVACVIQGGNIYWAHCGDSRLYLVRGDRLIARTRDHSYSELREALSHVVPLDEKVNRNVLFTCLGSPGKPVIDSAGPMVLRTGDRVLLCSDGLWSSVEDADIVKMMSDYPIHDSIPEIVEQALRNAGEKSDNVTALAVEWEASEDDDQAGNVSTRTLGEDVFASTIQASMSGDSFLPDIDDDEIERSIREINEAIQRSGPRKT